MEIVKLSTKGQITIPVSIRKKLGLEAGDKIIFREENGRFCFEKDNAVLDAFTKAAREFEGAAAEAGFNTEEELQEYARGIRKKIPD